MTSAGTVAAWSAMRAVYEGALPNAELLAAISRKRPKTIECRAVREGWLKAEESTERLTLAERISRLANALVGEMETIEKEGKGGVYDKARIETVAALMRALEKAGELIGAEPGKQEQQKKTDAEKADILRRIDERIVELARFFAEEIVAGRADAG
ncbi:hypothetical protein [Mesorhizobium sp. Z1-4]|uniref:hypothetical protein n=1 Tax=Mesorhizobium sp. Z1-4 TaxID=2448478 RepID=UPI000FD7B947|nr:hypothetical protein [Mesorhizobium sp. Z1-4]